MRGAFMCGLLLVAVWLGCDASGTTTGGAPVSADACDATNGGHTWTDLYTCYFGPSGKTSCVSQGFCHGGPDMTGALGSPFFVCGTSRESCYRGFTKAFSGCPDGGVADAAPDGEGDGPLTDAPVTDGAPEAASEAGATGEAGAAGDSGATPEAGPPVCIMPYAYFFGDVRGSTVTGFHNMPYSPAWAMQYQPGSTGETFTQADLARISAWIADGAQDD